MNLWEPRGAGAVNVIAPRRVTLLAILSVLPFTGGAASPAYLDSQITPPAARREFRGAWVASVSNIDWPSTNGLPVSAQKAELIRILDAAVSLKLNAIILQVRPACDVLYPSRIEPWSEYLTGQMGRAPSPFWDPLAFAVAEAHKRGLELHAWFNPYRARHSSAKSPISRNHISQTHPNLVRTYGRQLWLDPGEKEVQDYSLSVVMEVLMNYDVDGIHFDDYFYPYKELDAARKELDFPDEQSWRRYGARSGLSRDDWRRENVNVFIRRVYQSVKVAKPWVKFGVSPFGIWRPGNPPQIQGFDAYAKLYADAEKWLEKGWLDYLAPQLYWAINPPAQSFPVLLRWWASQNQKQRHLWPGLNSANVGRTWQPSEIVNQIKLCRQESGVTGHIHWNMRRGLMASNGLAPALHNSVYSEPALVPSCPWLSSQRPGKPTFNASRRKSGVQLTWSSGAGEKISHWVVQTRTRGEWTTRILAAEKRALVLETDKPDVASVTAINEYGNAGPPAVVALQQGR